MKKLLILFAALIGFAACESSEEHATLDRDLESYTTEELAVLSQGFDATKINHDQFLTDLTEGSISYARYLSTWRNEEEGWLYNPVYGGNGESSAWIFDADGEAVFCGYYESYEGDSAPTGHYICTERTWRYESQTGEIVIAPKENLSEVRLKVLYYKSPLLYYSQTAVNPYFKGELTRWVVDLHTESNAQAKKKWAAYIKQ